MLKKILINFIILFIFVGAYCNTPLRPAFAAEPGSEQDPVITKSYLESFYKWQTVTLKEGQKLVLDFSSEIIVLSGEAENLPTETGGVIDLTSGVYLKGKEMIPLYHLIISPKSDGRGIKINKDAEIMIRGTGK